MSITRGKFGFGSSTDYSNTQIHDIKLSPNGRYLILVYKGYIGTLSHIINNYILLDINRLIQLLDQYSDSTDQITLPNDWVNIYDPMSQITLVTNGWVKLPILSYNNRAKSLIGESDDNISDFFYVGFLDDEHVLTIRTFKKYLPDGITSTLYDIYHIPSQKFIDTGKNIPTESVRHGNFLFSGGNSHSYYRWNGSELTKMETSTLYSFAKRNAMEYIFENVRSDKLIMTLLNRDMIKSWMDFMYPGHNNYIIPIVNESPDSSKFILTFKYRYDFGDFNIKETLLYNGFYFINFVANGAVPYRIDQRYEAFTWTEDNKLLMMKYLRSEQSFQFDLYEMTNTGYSVSMLTKLKVDKLIRSFGDVINLETHVGYYGVGTWRINSVSDRIYFDYGIINLHNNVIGMVGVNFKISDHNDMHIYVKDAHLKGRITGTLLSFMVGSSGRQIPMPGLIELTRFSGDGLFFDISDLTKPLSIPGISANGSSAILYDIRTLKIMVTNYQHFSIKNPIMADNESIIIDLLNASNGILLNLYDIKVGYLKQRFALATTRQLITIDEFFQILRQIEEGKILAEEAVSVAPEIMLQPGGVLVPYFAAGTIAQFAPKQTAQYIPPAYQELYNICSNPEAVTKGEVLRIATLMGYKNTNLLFPLSNTEICNRLINFSQVQLSGRSPV